MAAAGTTGTAMEPATAIACVWPSDTTRWPPTADGSSSGTGGGGGGDGVGDRFAAVATGGAGTSGGGGDTANGAVCGGP